MDPFTAGLNAFKSFNEMLCTPEGQKLMAFNAAIVAKILGHFDVHFEANPPKTS